MSAAAAFRNLELAELEAQARERWESYVVHTLGQPNPRNHREAPSSRNTWRYGNKGALAVRVVGRRRGTFKDFSGGAAGGAFALAMFARHCSFSGAVEHVRGFLGLPKDKQPKPGRVHRDADVHNLDDARAIARARRIASELRGLHGNVADTYLTSTRAIPRPDRGWPAAIGFHSAERALAGVATLSDGTVLAVQITRLTLDATKAAADSHRPTKQTFGRMAGAAVRLPGPADQPLAIGEGIETALTAHVAAGLESWATLGAHNLAKHVESADPKRPLLMLMEDYAPQSPARLRLDRAVRTARKRGVVVHVCTPWPVSHGDGSDLNDVLRAEGVDAVRERIARVLHPGRATVERVSLDEARSRLCFALTDFAREADRWDGNAPPPVHALGADLGLGKTDAALNFALRRLIALRQAGSRKKIAVAVPTHDLAADLVTRAEEMTRRIAGASELKIAAWRGFDADDPDAAGLLMCRNRPAREAVEAVHDDMQTLACGKPGGDRCPLADECGYQRQRARRDVDLWLVPHALLFTEKPRTIRDLAFLLVDEAPWSSAIEGTAQRIEMPLDELRRSADRSGNWSAADRELLSELRARFGRALDGMPDGPVLREPLLADHMIRHHVAEARALEFGGLVEPDIRPGMSPAAMTAAAQAAAGNGAVHRRLVAWKAVEALIALDGPKASGRLSLRTDERGVRMVRLKGHREIRKGWLVPTLLADATLALDIARQFWPQVRAAAELRVEAPNMRVVQVVDSAFAKNTYAPLDPKQAAEKPSLVKRRERALRRLRAILDPLVRQYAPHRVLIVLQKAVEEALLALGPLPANVETAHHNAVRGRDCWRDVRAVIVVGRTQPSPAAAEDMAEAIFGCAVERLGADEKGISRWYPRADAERELADGSTMATLADRHPDPRVEGVRRQVCEAELVQIGGRGRGVLRGPDDPLDLVLLTDVPLPLAVSETITLAELEPSPIDRQLASGGLAFFSGACAARFYPKLWPSAAAARAAFSRASNVTFANRGISIRESHSAGLSWCQFRLAGPSHKRVVAAFDPDLVPDPRAVIEAQLGELGLFELLEGPPLPAQEESWPKPEQEVPRQAGERPESDYDEEGGWIPPWIWINRPIWQVRAPPDG